MTLEKYDEILKTFYLPVIEEQLKGKSIIETLHYGKRKHHEQTKQGREIDQLFEVIFGDYQKV